MKIFDMYRLVLFTFIVLTEQVCHMTLIILTALHVFCNRPGKNVDEEKKSGIIQSLKKKIWVTLPSWSYVVFRPHLEGAKFLTQRVICSVELNIAS